TTVEAIIRESPYQDANETWWLPIITISWVGDIPVEAVDQISLAAYGVVEDSAGKWHRFNWIELVTDNTPPTE
ncbi:hypothetical protein C4564_01350, partial [Candidatus Microgenomates bacterium]